MEKRAEMEKRLDAAIEKRRMEKSKRDHRMFDRFFNDTDRQCECGATEDLQPLGQLFWICSKCKALRDGEQQERSETIAAHNARIERWNRDAE